MVVLISNLSSVRRADLYTPPSSPQSQETDTEAEALIELKFREQFGYDRYTREDSLSVTHQPVVVKQDDDNNNDALEFRLFLGTPNISGIAGEITTKKSIHKITLRSPSPVGAEGGFVVPHRPLEYYFATNTAAEAKERFLNAAISGEDILKSAESIWVRYDINYDIQLVVTLANKLARLC